MKKLLVIIAILFRHIVFGQQVSKANDPVEWINLLMGIDSKFEMSNANTYPAIALHHGVHFRVPQIGRMRDGWIYTYNADKSAVLNKHINLHPG